MSRYKLRSTIYLVGSEYSQILGSKLPSNKQALSVFFYNHNIVNLTIRESLKLALKEVSVFWEKARILVQDDQHCITKLENLRNEWINLCKNKKRLSDTQKNNEKRFSDKLNDLFDISHANALQVMKNEGDKMFLINQRKKGRPGCLGGVNFKGMQKEKRKLQLLEAEARRKRRALDKLSMSYSSTSGDVEAASESKTERYTHASGSNANQQRSLKHVFNERVESGVDKCEISDLSLIEVSMSYSSTSGDDVEATSESKTERYTRTSGSNTNPKRGRKHIFNERVVSALDKCKISDRSAMHIVTAIAESLGHNTSDLIINRTSLQRQRKLNRLKKSEKIKGDFKIDRGILHWDGKLLPEITGHDKVERLPVIISHKNGEQLIGVPKLSAATGSEMADAIYEHLFEWNVEENIVACCFDTTASNTGVVVYSRFVNN